MVKQDGRKIAFLEYVLGLKDKIDGLDSLIMFNANQTPIYIRNVKNMKNSIHSIFSMILNKIKKYSLLIVLLTLIPTFYNFLIQSKKKNTHFFIENLQEQL